MVLKMLVLIPLTVGGTFLLVFMINHGSSQPGTAGGSACRSKSTAGSVFDIDWCQAGAAALQGAARGVAAGAGAAASRR